MPILSDYLPDCLTCLTVCLSSIYLPLPPDPLDNVTAAVLATVQKELATILKKNDDLTKQLSSIEAANRNLTGLVHDLTTKVDPFYLTFRLLIML